MYLTKTWGFSAPCGPLQFRTEGWRANARQKLQPGDLVLIVGTKGRQTTKDERGRLLGIMEPTTEPALSQDYDLQTRPIDYDESGHYRWPFGLINRRAWKIVDRKRLEDISSREFHMDAALGIVLLDASEAEAVMRLAREETDLLIPVRARARIEGEAVARRRASPPPATVRQGIMHVRQAPAYTYAMSIEGAKNSAFKIGWAFEYVRRQSEFNQAAMPALGGLEYRIRFHRLWDSARQAYRMEQWLLRKFNDARHSANHEIVSGISLSAVEGAWVEYIRLNSSL